MPEQASRNSLHPVLWIAAVAVILLSAAGIAAIFGVIPSAGSVSAPPAAEAAQETPLASPSAQTLAPPADSVAPPPVTIPQAAPEPQPAPAPAPVQKKPVVKKAAPQVASTPTPAAAPATPVAVAPSPAPAPVICNTCGTVEDIRQIEQKGEGSGLGAVAGGVAGAVLGHQVGKGGGKTAATVIGGVGGAVAGHQVEKYVRRSVRHEVTVRLEDGSSRSFSYDSPPAWRIGDRVRIDDDRLVAR